MKINEIIDAMEQTGMIPVFNHADVEVAKHVLDAAYNGGVRVFEFTNRGENALEVFTALKAYASRHTDLVLGIGTIFTPKEVEDFIAAGADFIVSPALIPNVAVTSNRNNVLWIPGCGTVTEIFNAKEMGAKVVKAFPGNVLGSSFVSAVKAVMPELKIMPTGGVEPTEDNLKEWFGAGVTCVGMGSQLFKKEWISQQKFDELEKQISETLNIIQAIRNK
ncbi:bifunctional 4-hydroxy-2-oxoglutarate aldolase/2-dehydro-3-deoxy-phosphogluconate aldolase [Echinicola pacifica]|uniref:Bifunctional 4-hydroxy-2-oxoglutarate aldolase/2-dehydro-3-deoxy-phosphogluconate aldolase n=1 Tax=Echinicola pacifica TaxID=346377 RepID=A0A918UKL4_9BACT|nr:bifunctional 4-hydroxy-2-oxoglutarate aldolase/2-dehydro-3-deoxy-phosphogluconate aldolase [Echinicola pacifica]GGZ16450.1 bifunctional 4-hydroxy-2-oxoglutarate aldolase/2-dehydro-3-deoxy-phosphogluconate aldolase [Echinicola pacifica]